MAVNRLILSLFVSCIAFFSAVSSQSSEASCDGAKTVYKGLNQGDGRQENIIFNVPEKASEMSRCPSEMTCCSVSAEEDFASMAADSLTDRAVKQLEETITPCSSSFLKDDLVTYINSSKAELVDIMQLHYGRYFKKLDIFDEFYEYLQFAVQTGNACDLGFKFYKVFFEVFLAVLEAHPQVRTDQYPDTDEFHVCLYSYYLEKNSARVYNNFQALTRSFNRTLYYLRALNTAEEVLRNVVDLRLTPQCALATQRMTYCAQCAGYDSSALPCMNLCLNTLRGCFVDLSDLYLPFKEFMAAVVGMKEYLEVEVCPWVHINQLQVNFINLITDTVQLASTIHQDILINCRTERAARQQESAGESNHQSSLFPRSTVTPPSTAFNQSAYCLMDVVPMFQNLPETVCEAMANNDNQHCWTGRGMGSYDREVLSYSRQAQLDNPELIVCHSLPQTLKRDILKLKMVTKELNIISRNEECPEDDEDCSVDDQRCDYSVPIAVVPSKPHPDIIDLDVDMQESSGSGSGSGYGSGSSSGCGPDEEGSSPCVEIEADACLAEPVFSALPSAAPTTVVLATPTPKTTPPPKATTPPTVTTVDSSAPSLASSLTLLLLSVLFLCVL